MKRFFIQGDYAYQLISSDESLVNGKPIFRRLPIEDYTGEVTKVCVYDVRDQIKDYKEN